MKKWFLTALVATTLLSNTFAAMPFSEEVKERNVTREEFFAMICESGNENSSDELKFDFEDEEDITPEYRKYVFYLANEEIISGNLIDGKNYLEPKKEISKMEAAIILTKFLGLYSTAPSNLLDTDIPVWASDYIHTAVNFGIMPLDENGYFNTNSVLTESDIKEISGHLYDMGYLEERNIEVYAGNGMSTLVDGELNTASFFAPTGIVMYKDALYVADTKNNAIREIKDDNVSTVAGTYDARDEFDVSIGSFADGSKAKFDTPSFLATPKNGLLITDTNNNLIRYYINGKVSTYAGNIGGGYKDGSRTRALFNKPTGIVATNKGIIYIADTGNNVIRKIDRNDSVSTYAGVVSEDGGYKDGKVREAMFNRPTGLYLKDDVLYVADSGNQRIRKIENGKVTTVAGGGDELYDDSSEIIGDYIDGSVENARFNFPQNLVVDDAGNIYVADTGNSAIRKIDTKGNVSTLLGLSSNDNVELINPVGLMIDSGKLYVTDTIKNIIITIDIEEAK